MTTLFVRNARRKWNASDVLERAYAAAEVRRWFEGLEFSVAEVASKKFDELDDAIALRLAEYFWASRGSR